METLIKSLERLGSPRVMLVGDFMLDKYVYGFADRICPESPVPVLNVVRHEYRLGGAAGAAAAIAALGAKVACVGLLGDDDDGKELIRLLDQAGADTSGMLTLSERRTTVKTRFVGLAQHRHPQQMLRADAECPLPLRGRGAEMLLSAVTERVGDCDVVALEDYDKGVLCPQTSGRIIAAARKAAKKVIADPACIENYSRYRGATVLTPNRYEAALASGVKITDDQSLLRAGEEILRTTSAQAVVITLDKDGAFVLQKDHPPKKAPTRPRSIYDVSGAGDEVLAALAVAIADGWDYLQATRLANVAGGLEVERFGVSPVSRQEIADELNQIAGLRNAKIHSRKKLARELDRRRQRGHKVVFTNGCFDLLHMGHVRYLQQARQLGNCLIVAVNSDHSVRRLKGPSRPVIGQDERAEMIASLECVDYVTIFPEDTPVELIGLLKPDVLVKGGTTDVIPGRDIVEGYGGKVLILDKVEGLSTTNIINRILNATKSQDNSA